MSSRSIEFISSIYTTRITYISIYNSRGNTSDNFYRYLLCSKYLVQTLSLKPVFFITCFTSSFFKSSLLIFYPPSTNNFCEITKTRFIPLHFTEILFIQETIVYKYFYISIFVICINCITQYPTKNDGGIISIHSSKYINITLSSYLILL